MQSPTILHIPVQNLKTFGCIDTLLAQLGAQRARVDKLVLDLSSIKFVTPAGGLALALAARMASGFAEYVELTNVNPKIASYLHRVDLHQIAGGKVILPTLEEEFKRSSASTSVVEIRSIPSDPTAHREVRKVAEQRLLGVLSSWYPLNAALELTTVVCELMKNITHSEELGYVVVQKYWNRLLKMNEVCIAVGDLGLGIRRTLSRSPRTPQFENDSDFIQYALDVHGSCGNGGNGLTAVDMLIKQWNGVLTMRSGAGRVTVEQGARFPEDRLVFIPGVQVSITVRA